MSDILHITNGDGAGGGLAQSGLAGEILIWNDLLYEGKRSPGWPDESTLRQRSRMLSEFSGVHLTQEEILAGLNENYLRLKKAPGDRQIVLWFDACLCDQAMLAHILTCLHQLGGASPELICIDSFPGITRFNGLGQLRPDQLKSLWPDRVAVTDEQLRYALRVDAAFASQDVQMFQELVDWSDAPLPFVPAAVARWLQEQPHPVTGLGLLQQLALDAIQNGRSTPWEVFQCVAEGDTSPLYWGDATLWREINRLAEVQPQRILIEGPSGRLPQGGSVFDLKMYRIVPVL